MELPSWRLSPNRLPFTGTPGSGHSLCRKAVWIGVKDVIRQKERADRPSPKKISFVMMVNSGLPPLPQEPTRYPRTGDCCAMCGIKQMVVKLDLLPF